MSGLQTDLFGDIPSSFPKGFKYQEEVISADQESALIEAFQVLPFKNFEFQGYEGKRRVVSFGWQYDFTTHQLGRTLEIPGFLLELRKTMARFSDIKEDLLQQVLVSEYSPGAGIGWHKDRPVFNEIIGLSLGAGCKFRLRQRNPKGWARVTIAAQPRSAYLLSGEVRTLWEHSIPPVESLRYSVTFRSLVK
jgi:alkylated DNA repair dioxygenase AlkB